MPSFLLNPFAGGLVFFYIYAPPHQLPPFHFSPLITYVLPEDAGPRLHNQGGMRAPHDEAGLKRKLKTPPKLLFLLGSMAITQSTGQLFSSDPF